MTRLREAAIAAAVAGGFGLGLVAWGASGPPKTREVAKLGAQQTSLTAVDHVAPQATRPSVACELDATRARGARAAVRPSASASGHDPIRQAIEEHDWTAGVAALLHGSRGQRDLETTRAAARLELFLADLQEQLGAPDRESVLRDARVQEAFLPAWVEALGIALSPTQRDGVRSVARERARAINAVPEEIDPTRVGRVAQELHKQLQLEASLGDVLDPLQRGRYAAAQANRPLARALPPQARVSASTPEQLAQRVAATWLASFGLGEGAKPHAEAEAKAWVRAVLSVPAVQGEGFERRQSELQRLAKLAELQAAAERRLADRLPSRGEARHRVSGGSGYLLVPALS